MDLMQNSVRFMGHNCVRFETSGENKKVIYTDPFRLSEAPHDADLILITHDHYDHLSTEDIEKAAAPGCQLVMPEGCKGELPDQIVGVFFVRPSEQYQLSGLSFETVPAYNIGKPFHPKENGWVGYILSIEGVRYYVAGDTDDTPELEAADADVAFLPVGGTFTMTAEEAAEAARKMKAELCVPVHYAVIVGSPDDADRFVAQASGKGLKLSF